MYFQYVKLRYVSSFALNCKKKAVSKDRSVVTGSYKPFIG